MEAEICVERSERMSSSWKCGMCSYQIFFSQLRAQSCTTGDETLQSSFLCYHQVPGRLSQERFLGVTGRLEDVGNFCLLPLLVIRLSYVGHWLGVPTGNFLHIPNQPHHAWETASWHALIRFRIPGVQGYWANSQTFQSLCWHLLSLWKLGVFFEHFHFSNNWLPNSFIQLTPLTIPGAVSFLTMLSGYHKEVSWQGLEF